YTRARSPQKLSFQYLDDYVKRFVGEKTGLGVRVDLQTNWVAIKSLEANGSVALAMFWIKVLQHKDNYPTDRVHYHRGRDSETGADRLLIRVDDVTICLNLSTGLLEISGPHVLQWIKKRFLKLLRAYDGFKDTADWYGDEFADEDRIDLSLPLRASSGDRYGDDRQIAGGVLDGLWQGQALDSRIERAKIPSVQPTADYVWPMLKSLLFRWLSDEHTQVCLITSQMDSTALRELCQLACSLKSTASFSMICAPFKADPVSGKDLPSVRTSAMKDFPAQEQMWLEYKLMKQITSPMVASGLNLIAGLRLGQAQVLLTSAPFHSSSSTSKVRRADSVQFLQLTESIFMHDFVQPLNRSM
ncbi:hypothetical protein BOX15_Mlig004046g5, partial [Macrostomum lignano]